MNKVIAFLLAMAGASCALAVEVLPLPTAPGSILKAGAAYVVDHDVTVTGLVSQSALTLTNGITLIDVKKGCRLTVRGGQASGRNPAGAGIALPEAASLVLLGEGTVDIKGGDAANGADSGMPDSGESGVGGWSRGGAGGDGGGGAGSGIGSSGSSGGEGGTQGEMSCSVSESTPGANGGNGNPGGQCGDLPKVGRLYLLGSVSGELAGGSQGRLGVSRGKSGFINKIKIGLGFLKIKVTGYIIGAGGDGGGGSGGRSGSGFGTAGYGGRGGGGGGAGGLACAYSEGAIGWNIIKTIRKLIKEVKGVFHILKAAIGDEFDEPSGGSGYNEHDMERGVHHARPGTSRSIYQDKKTWVSGGSGGQMPALRDENIKSGYIYQGADNKVRIVSLKANKGKLDFDWSVRTQVTLDQGPADIRGTEGFTATFGKRLPNIIVPARANYTFMGYYTEQNGAGRRYFLANGEPSAQPWDSYVDTITLYAHWVEGVHCGLLIDGVDPTKERRKGVSLDESTRIITIVPDADFEGPHVVSGMDANGYRLKIDIAANVVFSNAQIRLPAQDRNARNDIRERVPLYIQRSSDSNTTCSVGFIGSNRLSAAEGTTDENGGPDTEVPAVVVEDNAWFCRKGEGVDILRLSGAGGAPAIMRYADTNTLDLSRRNIEIAFDGGTYVLEPSVKTFDSGLKEHQQFRYVKPVAIDFDGSIVAEVAWRSTSGENDDFWRRALVEPYKDASRFREWISGGSVNSGTATLGKKTPYCVYEDQTKGDLGEIVVDLWNVGLTNAFVDVVIYDSDFRPSELYRGFDFARIAAVDDELRLWLKAGVEQYFLAGDVLFKAMPKIGERVVAERVDVAVLRVWNGRCYPTLAAAIRDMKNGPVGPAETLRLLKDVHESVSVEQMCDTLTIDGANHIISNTAANASAPMFWQHDNVTDQMLVLTNIVLSGFVSTDEPLISTSGRLRLYDCDLVNDRTSVELIRSSFELVGETGFVARGLRVADSTALTALTIDNAAVTNGWAILYSGSFDGEFQDQVTVNCGRLDVGADVDAERFRLGLLGQLAYLEDSKRQLLLRLDMIQHRLFENPILIANAYKHPKPAGQVDLRNIEYLTESDASGNVLLADTRQMVYAAVKDDGDSVYSQGDDFPVCVCRTYSEIPDSFAPTTTVYALRKIYLQSHMKVAGTGEACITIPAGRYDSLESCEFVISNSVDCSTRSLRGMGNLDCDPVTLDCEARVDGTLRLGNIRIAGPILLGANGVLVIGDEYDLTNTTNVIRLADPSSEGWWIKSTRYSLEDLVRHLALANDDFNNFVVKDGRIRPGVALDEKVYLEHNSTKTPYASTFAAFAHAESNDVVHLRKVFPSTTIGLSVGTTLGSRKTIVVDTIREGLGALTLTPAVLAVDKGSLTVEKNSVVRFSDIEVEGVLTLKGSGRIDLFGWTGNPISLRPTRRGLVASNVPEGKLNLAAGVEGQLWRNSDGNVYYVSEDPISWGFVQTGNGVGTLYVTNSLGEVSTCLLDPTNYVSIASQGLARVRLEDLTLGLVTNVDVVVVYCDLDTGELKLADGYDYEYLAEGEITDENGDIAEQLAKTSWKKLEKTDVSQLRAQIEALLNVQAGATEGDEELAFDEHGNIITNRRVKLSAKLSAVPKLSAGFSDVMAFVPSDALVDLASGRIGIRVLRKFSKPGSAWNTHWTTLLDNREYLDNINLLAKTLNSSVSIFENLISGDPDAALDSGFRTILGTANAHINKKLKDKEWYKRMGGRAQFATRAGIRAAFTCVANLLKDAATPIQFQGKYYTRKCAPVAYEACIAKNDEDAAVHVQAPCRLPGYTVTNGTLRVAGDFEGGWKSVVFGVLSNGKQWTSGTSTAKIIGGVGKGVLDIGWAVLYRKFEDDSRLANTAGNMLGNLISGIRRQVCSPYSATPKEKGEVLLTVEKNAKLVYGTMRYRDGAGALIEVRNGGEAQVKDVKIDKGYSLDNDNALGVFGVRKGGKLLLEEVESGKDLTVLGAEDGSDLTVKDGEFNKSTFNLKGAVLKLGSSSKLKEDILVSGRNQEGDAFALKTGADDIDYWKNFKSTADDSLTPRFDGDNVVWGYGDPIGTVRGDKMTTENKFTSLTRLEALMRAAGDTVTVTFLKDVSVLCDWKFPKVKSLTIEGGKRFGGIPLLGRSEPLFELSSGDRLELKGMTFSGFDSSSVPLVRSDGGTVVVNNSVFDNNAMTAILDLSGQSGCESVLSGFDARNDRSACSVRLNAVGATDRTILVSGVVSNKVALSVYGEGTVPVNGHFVLDNVKLEGKTALGYNEATPAPFAVQGSSEHLSGMMYVINNGCGVKIPTTLLTVLNKGYQAVEGEDGNIYLRNPQKEPTKCNELVYNPTNDVFSVTNGIIPSVADTNWTAQTVLGTNATFRYGRLARDAFVNVTNGDLVVCCHGTNFVMSGIGATPAEKRISKDALLACIGDILEDGSAWFEGSVASNVTAEVIDACLTKKELSVTSRDIYDALMYCTACFAYNGELYLQSESDAVFAAAISSGLPVTVLRDVGINPFTVCSGETLRLNATNEWKTTAFSNEIVNVEQAFKWVATMKILPVMEKVAAIRNRGIYSGDIYNEAITVASNGVCIIDGLVMTNDWRMESVVVDRFGTLELHGDTVIPSVRAYGRSLKTAEDFTGSVGVTGRAGAAGVVFGECPPDQVNFHGHFYSNMRKLALTQEGNGRFKWLFTGDIAELVPKFSSDDPLDIAVDDNKAVVGGTIQNPEPGLWYYFETSTNLVGYSAITNSCRSPGPNATFRFLHTHNIQTNAADSVRFFRVRIDDKPLGD